MINNKELAVASFKSSLYATAKVLCGYDKINWKTHGPMIEALESPEKRKLIVAPRGSFKTSLCIVAFAVWRIINDPNERILLDSEVFVNAKNLIKEIKHHLETPLMEELFGKFRNQSNWNESSFTINQRTRKYKESTAIAGSPGTQKTGQHFSLWLMDDLNSSSNSNTKELAEKILNHYRLGLSILEPDGTIVVCATRYSELDLVQFILDNEVNSKEGLINGG